MDDWRSAEATFQAQHAIIHAINTSIAGKHDNFAGSVTYKVDIEPGDKKIVASHRVFKDAKDQMSVEITVFFVVPENTKIPKYEAEVNWTGIRYRLGEALDDLGLEATEDKFQLDRFIPKCTCKFLFPLYGDIKEVDPDTEAHFERHYVGPNTEPSEEDWKK